MKPRLACFLTVLAWLYCLPTASAESYFMVVFATDRGAAPYSHTFATFVKTTEEGTLLDVQTISWMPRTLNIFVLAPAEPGVNLDLHASLQWALSRNVPTFQWGPFEIKRELYDRAATQIARLNSGTVAYKALDRRLHPGNVSNCIHAVSDIEMDRGVLHVGLAHGRAASQLVVWHLQPWIIHPEEHHEWVTDLLGLGDYPITHEDRPNGRDAP